ncbi:10483_t:CDS:2, partial [Funneliformis mosseae]
MNGSIHILFILGLLFFFVFNTSASCGPTSCRCPVGTKQGQYCGEQLPDPNCLAGYVYECNPSGAACVYGIRTTCVKCGCLQCPCPILVH